MSNCFKDRPTDIDIIEIKDKNNKYGKLILNKTSNSIYFINNNKEYFELTKPNKCTPNAITPKYLTYCGMWQPCYDYKINSIVKYKNKLYIAKRDILQSNNTELNEDWELILDNNSNNNAKCVCSFAISCNENKGNNVENDDVEKTDMHNERRQIDISNNITVSRTMHVLDIKHNNILPDFIELINNSYYITNKGSYNITYNLTYLTNIQSFETIIFVINDIEPSKPSAINESIANCFGNTKTSNINHNFILKFDNKDKNKTEYLADNNNFMADSFEIESSYKIIFCLRFLNEDIGNVLCIDKNRSWMNIYEI